MMVIDAERDRAAEFLAGANEPRRRRRNRFARLEDVLRRLPDGKEPDAGPAEPDQLLGFLDHRRSGGERRREGRHTVAMPSPEQLIDRNAKRLAFDVIKSDVDRRDRAREHATAFEVLASIHFLPERASAHRIAPDQELAIVLDGADYSALAVGHPQFAPAIKAFVGLDLDDELIAVADPDRIGVNGRYLHGLRGLIVFAARFVRPTRVSPFDAPEGDCGPSSPAGGPIHHSPWLVARSLAPVWFRACMANTRA